MAAAGQVAENFSTVLAVLTASAGLALVIISIYSRTLEIRHNKEKLIMLEEERKKNVALNIQKNEQRIMAAARKRKRTPSK